MNQILALISISLLIYTAVSIANRLSLLKYVDIKIVKYDILKVSSDNIAIRLYLRLTNPSDIEIKIKDFNFTIYINGKSITDYDYAIAQTLEPKKSLRIPIEVQFDPKKIINIAIQKDVIEGLLLNIKQLKIQIKGYFSVSHKFIDLKKLPFDYQTTLFEIKNKQAA